MFTNLSVLILHLERVENLHSRLKLACSFLTYKYDTTITYGNLLE